MSTNNWKQDLQETLEAGKQPTYEQLEAALKGALKERNAMERSFCDMATWLGRMLSAHVHDTGGGLSQVMNEFIAARVKIKVEPAASGAVH